MKENRNSSERGQAIVLIMLAIVALLGFTALAVDGSMLYSDRRASQSGSDSSSLAGGGVLAQEMVKNGLNITNFTFAGTTCTGAAQTAVNKAVNAAISRSSDNGFIIDNDISDNNGVQVTCGVDSKIVRKNGYCSCTTFTLYEEGWVDIRTTITRATNTAFLHFVYQGAAQNVVTSVVRVRLPQPLAYGYALVALNPAQCSGNSNGIQSGGNNTTIITGGGMFSNGCLDHDGSKIVKIYDGSVAYFYGGGGVSSYYRFYDKNNNQLTGANAPFGYLVDSYARIPASAYDIPVPDCNAAGAHKGTYASLLSGKSGLSGLYCITDNLGSNFSGTNMTVVVLGGSVTFHGDIDISAPGAGYTGLAIPGVAIYLPKSYYGTCGDKNQEVKINGGSTLRMNGALLAPCSDVSIEGGSTNNPILGQVIGWNVNFRGNSDLIINYNNANKYLLPAKLDVFR